MKVVLFCGGLGTRMRDAPDTGVPKPMTTIGERPVLWHIMRYYAYFGHRDFVLCLGYGGRTIKDYFLCYDETWSNDFTLRPGPGEVTLLTHDVSDWTITFVDTGLHASIGERLAQVREHLEGEEMFLANYGDVVTDLALDVMVDRFKATDAVAGLLAVRPYGSHHVLDLEGDRVAALRPVATDAHRINGGYFVLRPEIFDELGPGEDLVGPPLDRLAARRALFAHTHEGFWAPMDTVKERLSLESMYQSGERPWMLWDDRRTASGGARPGA